MFNNKRMSGLIKDPMIHLRYKGYLVEKYGEDDSHHPRFDEPLWSRASQETGGKNKGKLYGLRNISDPLGFITVLTNPCGHVRYELGLDQTTLIWMFDCPVKTN
ncbi:hypothetical protein R6Q59_003207 [Mikania micrantha]